MRVLDAHHGLARDTTRDADHPGRGRADGRAGFGREGYPSAVTSVARHAALNGCGAETVTGDPLDLDTGIDGAESTPLTHTDCPAGGDAALWTIEGGTHVPALAGAGTQAMLTWLLARGRTSAP